MISQQEKEEILLLIQDTIKHKEKILDQFKMKKKMIISLEEQLAYYKNINEEMKQFQPNQHAEKIIAQAKEDADYIVYDALVQAKKVELGTSSVKRELAMFKDSLKKLLEREWKILEEFDHLQGKE